MKVLAQPHKIASVKDLREFQRLMASTLFLPLTPAERLNRRWVDGRTMSEVASGFVKPNDRLTSFERLEIYSRSYWFRVLNCFYEDFPGLRAVVGERAFGRLAEAYLTRYPSTSFTLRDLGSRIEPFLRENRALALSKSGLAIDVARIEWAQVEAFDGPGRTPLNIDDLPGADPVKLRLGLQPYLRLIACDYPVDDFVMAVKKHEALRNDASNAKTASPVVRHAKKAPRPRLTGRVFIAVHRYGNRVFLKRLEQGAFLMLSALRRGATIEQACEEVLREIPAIAPLEIKDWFKNASALGWFCKFNPNHL